MYKIGGGGVERIICILSRPVKNAMPLTHTKSSKMGEKPVQDQIDKIFIAHETGVLFINP
jgi:hypothetical protein